MTNYKLPTQPDVMTTDTIGYDKQSGAWTYNGQPIREMFLWIKEKRTPQQIVAELTACVEGEETTALEQIVHGQEVNE